MLLAHQQGHRGSTIRGAHAVRVLGCFRRPNHIFDSEVHASPELQKVPHYCTTAPCPLTVSPTSLSWLPVSITVTHTRPNGDRVPVTRISTSEWYVSIK